MKWGIVALALVMAAGCSKKETAEGVESAEAAELESHHECAACGMVVAEQSAARAQAVHRDGTRQYFCSIGDMLAYLDTPSPHGKIVATYVETMDPSADPTALSLVPRPWKAADQAAYVTGLKKRVMGKPVMVYDTEAQAQAVAEKYGGAVVTWTALKAAGH
jgi:nitrous oxide reductase accessory protein NosL